MNPFRDAVTFVDILRWRAEHEPDRMAHSFLRDGSVGIVLSYAELDLKRERLLHNCDSWNLKAAKRSCCFLPALISSSPCGDACTPALRRYRSRRRVPLNRSTGFEPWRPTRERTLR